MHLYLFKKLKNSITYLGESLGIQVIIQEESYTSKSSFYDNDEMPIYKDEHIVKFSGKRITRGMYQTASGKIINGDINAALNILRKSKLEKTVIMSLQSSGVNTPVRQKVV